RIRPTLASIFVCIAIFVTPTAALSEMTSDGDITDGAMGVGVEDAHSDSSAAENANNMHATDAGGTPNQPRYNYVWEPVSEFSGCGADLDGGSWSCTPHPESCEAGTGSQFAGEGDDLQLGTVSTTPVEGVTQRGPRIDYETAVSYDLPIRCCMSGSNEYAASSHVIILLTRVALPLL